MTKYKRIGPKFEGVQFDGRNGKAIKDFLLQNFVEVRYGPGWIKTLHVDGREETHKKDTWFLRDIVTGSMITGIPNAFIRIDFRRQGKPRGDIFTWIQKGGPVEAIQFDGNSKEVSKFARSRGALDVRANKSSVSFEGHKVQGTDYLVWHEDALVFEVMYQERFEQTFKAA